MISPEIITLFSENFGLESDPSEGPWVPTEMVLELAKSLYDKGFLYFSYCAAAHYPATEEEPGYFNVSYRVRRVGSEGDEAAFRVRVPLDGESPSLAGIWAGADWQEREQYDLVGCLLYTSPSPRDRTRSRMPSSA